MLKHLTPNATITFGTTPEVETTSRSQKQENILVLRGNTTMPETFNCPVLLHQVAANDLHKVALSPLNSSGGAVFAAFLPKGQVLPNWVKAGSKISVEFSDGDRFAGQLHFRRGRDAFSIKHQLGPSFFVSEIGG